MIANSAFLAAMVLALLVFSLMDQLAFLAPYKRLILGIRGTRSSSTPSISCTSMERT
jgi:hypothetical protein